MALLDIHCKKCGNDFQMDIITWLHTQTPLWLGYSLVTTPN